MDIFEVTVEDGWEDMARQELGCEKKTLYVLQLQWYLHKYCVEIRCQDTTSKYWVT
jgi:hypothetical protein